MASQPVVFSTQTRYALPSTKFMIPVDFKRYQLSQLVNKALSLPKPVPFDFLVRGQLLGSRSLREWCSENNTGEEETLQVEYIESVLPPQKVSDFKHDNWVSSVSCKLKSHFLTASYDGHIRAFDYSKNIVLDAPIHSGPATCVHFLPSSVSHEDGFTIATASHDMTASLSQVLHSSSDDISHQGESIDAPYSFKWEQKATLHLHTGPVSSISSNLSGRHLITSSWDGLVGLWDTLIPESDQIPEPTRYEHSNGHSHHKRRKINSDEPTRIAVRRKAPLNVLKSHTSKVSKALFLRNDNTKAISCGFDSSLRLWDIENGLCTRSIVASEKPFLDIAISSDENLAIAASTDRIVVGYDIRSSPENSNNNTGVVSLLHPATPSCVVSTPNDSFKILTGSYDGVVRVWDLRYANGTVASFKVWDSNGSKKKILALDWHSGMVGVGGEGGMEVWKIPEGTTPS